MGVLATLGWLAPAVLVVESARLPDALAAVQPTKAAPVKVADVDGPALGKAYQQWLAETPAEAVGKHPLADDFPGAVPADAKRVGAKVTIDPAVRRWQSTGLYAAAGEVVTVTAPPAAIGKLTVRVGAHKDKLWGYKPESAPKWERFPQLDASKAVSAAKTTIACPFGGPVYLEVAEGAPGRPFDVTVAGVVEAPLFVLGKTDPKAWAATIRNRPGPWAELVAKNVIFTVPSAEAARIDDPTELLVTWDKCMDACADLAGRPRVRTSPERFVFDRQISAGWMHSGYPIMAHLASTKEAIVLKELKTAPWGPSHEIGHNYQQPAWTNGFNGEVSNNLFPLYVREKVFNLGFGGHPAIRPEQLTKRLTPLFALPAAERNPDLFDRLYMYVLITRDFGWGPWTKTWQAYDALPRGQAPKGDQGENTQWLIQMSKLVKHNLAPYCREWNFPADYTQLGEIERLPVWMPKGFPKEVVRSSPGAPAGELLR